MATQGPLDNTVEDFWRMIVQVQAPVIVNLTTCCENGKNKCARYWPATTDGASQTYGRFTVTVKKCERATEKNKDKLDVYTLEVLPDGCSNSLIVRLINTADWPDGGTMPSAMTTLRLIKSIYLADTLAKGAVVIHCSAGIGRTGSLVLIDYCLCRLFSLYQPPNLEEAFMQLREQRASSVQKEQQFVHIVICIVAYIAARIPKYDKDWKNLEDTFMKKYCSDGK